MNKIYYNLSVILAAATMTAFVAVLILMFWPYRTINYEYFNIVNPELRAGESIEMEVSYCRYTNKPTSVVRRLENDIIYTLAEQIVNAPMGCHTSTVFVYIPLGVESGTYKLVSVVSWKVNPLRTITKQLNCGTFEVIK